MLSHACCCVLTQHRVASHATPRPVGWRHYAWQSTALLHAVCSRLQAMAQATTPCIKLQPALSPPEQHPPLHRHTPCCAAPYAPHAPYALIRATLALRCRQRPAHRVGRHHYQGASSGQSAQGYPGPAARAGDAQDASSQRAQAGAGAAASCAAATARDEPASDSAAAAAGAAASHAATGSQAASSSSAAHDAATDAATDGGAATAACAADAPPDAATACRCVCPCCARLLQPP
jgi:hypothetical protein